MKTLTTTKRTTATRYDVEVEYKEKTILSDVEVTEVNGIRLVRTSFTDGTLTSEDRNKIRGHLIKEFNGQLLREIIAADEKDGLYD